MKYFFCCLCIGVIFLLYVFINISDNEKYVTALFGLVGVIVGGIISLVGNLVQEWYKNKDKKELDKKREELLKQMLQNTKFEWRDINTLANVIGASKDETRRLLINIGARASEKRDNEKELWALLKDKPLPDKEQ